MLVDGAQVLVAVGEAAVAPENAVLAHRVEQPAVGRVSATVVCKSSQHVQLALIGEAHEPELPHGRLPVVLQHLAHPVVGQVSRHYIAASHDDTLNSSRDQSNLHSNAIANAIDRDPEATARLRLAI